MTMLNAPLPSSRREGRGATAGAAGQGERVGGLAADERQLTAADFFDRFVWEPPPNDPRRVSAEAFLRAL